MIAQIITGLVAIEAIIIMMIEMFGSVAQQAKSFELEPAVLKMPEVTVLLATHIGDHVFHSWSATSADVTI